MLVTKPVKNEKCIIFYSVILHFCSNVTLCHFLIIQYYGLHFYVIEKITCKTFEILSWGHLQGQ